MPLPTRPLCCFRHYLPWHLDHPSLILVWCPCLCSQLVEVISVILLLPCQMWNRPVLLIFIFLRCPPRLCPWSTTLRHVHHSSQYPHFLLFLKPSPLHTWHSALSFLPSDSLSIDHLHSALDRISSWMTANLLTLNSSKTEFLLIGVNKQLAKINNSSLTTTHSARNLSFIFDEHLTFSDQISSVSKSCYYRIRQLRCIRPYLDTKTASTSVVLIIEELTFLAIEPSTYGITCRLIQHTLLAFASLTSLLIMIIFYCTVA